MINYEKTMAWRSGDVVQTYTPRDTILYALSLGVGTEPLDRAHLRFVYEQDLVALPTMAAVLGSAGPWMLDREFGIDVVKLVLGEQSIVVHAPLPPQGTVIGRSRVLEIEDKGVDKGAVMRVEKQLSSAETGVLLATTEQAFVLRGDGGFSMVSPKDSATPRATTATLSVEPRFFRDLPTRPDTALLYRLTGDMHPLHVDPSFAVKAGFPRPILHGLATLGMSCHGLLGHFCGYEPSRMRSISARMKSPVFPGETVRLEAWDVTNGTAAFRCRVVERDVTVLTQGRMSFEP